MTLEERIRAAIIFNAKHMSAYEPYMERVLVEIEPLVKNILQILEEAPLADKYIPVTNEPSNIKVHKIE